MEKFQHNVACDGCGSQVAGVRYKCTICKNLDFCATCEEQLEHPHPCLKIYRKDQVPSAIFTVIDESMPDAEADIEKDISEVGDLSFFGLPAKKNG